MARSLSPWLVAVLALSALLGSAGPAAAQTVPFLIIDDLSGLEGNSGTTIFNLFVRISTPSSQNVTVHLRTEFGGVFAATGAANCGVAGADVVSIPDLLVTIAPNTPGTNVPLAICGDTRDEGNETFFVIISNPVNASCVGSDCINVVTILDDEPVVSISNATVTEADTTSRLMTFNVTLSAAAGVPLLIGASTADGTATGGASCSGTVDYIAASGAISFNVGDVSRPFTVNVCGDLRDEPNETLFVNLGPPAGAVLGDAQGVGTIIDNDPLPTISIFNRAVNEGNSCTGTTICANFHLVSLNVTLSAPSGKTVSVDYATRASSATSDPPGPPLCGDGDFASSSGTLTFAPGETSKPVAVAVCKDNTVEPDETFFVDLTGPLNANCLDCTGFVRILNDDGTTGSFEVSPQDARVHVGEHLNYAFTWTVPGVWRDLKTLDFRIRGDRGLALWLRWDEIANTFSLCGPVDDDDGRPNAPCAAGAAPGSPTVLETRLARVHMVETSVVGTGPTGPSVTLNLSVSFKPGAVGDYTILVAATDDLGHRDPFNRAGTVQVVRAGGS